MTTPEPKTESTPEPKLELTDIAVSILHLPDGSTFRCLDCFSTVFKKLSPVKFQCNSCGSTYTAELPPTNEKEESGG